MTLSGTDQAFLTDVFATLISPLEAKVIEFKWYEEKYLPYIGAVWSIKKPFSFVDPHLGLVGDDHRSGSLCISGIIATGSANDNGGVLINMI